MQLVDKLVHQMRTVISRAMQVLGIGSDGHIAFNEPGSALDSRTRIVELADSTRANMQAVFNCGEIPTHAVTIGLAATFRRNEQR